MTVTIQVKGGFAFCGCLARRIPNQRFGRLEMGSFLQIRIWTLPHGRAADGKNSATLMGKLLQMTGAGPEGPDPGGADRGGTGGNRKGGSDMKERKIMSAEEYLRQITEADERVWKLETRVNNLRTLATDNAQYLNGPIGHGQTDYDKTGTLMAEICDAEQELAEARNADFRIREEVGRTICRIENTDAQDVIFMRYMKGMKWDEIAAEKIFSVQRVYQLRRIGIEEMERVIFGFAKD